MRDEPPNTEQDSGYDDRNNLLKAIERHIQQKTVAGLLDLVPLLVTIVVVAFLMGKADALVRPLPFVSGQIWDFPGIGLIVCVAAFYLVGLAITTSFGSRMSSLKDTLIKSVPVVGSIFGVSQQAMASFTAQHSFTRVVFLEWPREGMIAMGFVTGRAFSEKTADSMAVIYIPTIPNPTSGNMALVMEDDLIETDLTVEAAMKLVFSGGIVLPDNVSLARVPRDAPDGIEMIGTFNADKTRPH